MEKKKERNRLDRIAEYNSIAFKTERGGRSVRLRMGWDTQP
jgi:hypothetical protein